MPLLVCFKFCRVTGLHRSVCAEGFAVSAKEKRHMKRDGRPRENPPAALPFCRWVIHIGQRGIEVVGAVIAGRIRRVLSWIF